MNDCACVWVGDYEVADFYSVTPRRARKEHKCYECGYPIAPREIYEESTGKWDDRLDRFKTCLDCVSLRHAFFCSGFCHGNLWEAFGDHLCECFGHISADKIAELKPRARDRVCDMVEEYWDDEEED